MKKQLETEPVQEQRTYHGEVLTNADSDDDSSEDEEHNDLSSVTSTYPESLAGTATGNLVGDFDNLSLDDSASTTTGGFWTPIKDRSVAGVSAPNTVPASSNGRSGSCAGTVSSTWSASKAGSSSGGFDAVKYGHPRAASVADSMETNRPASSSGGKWAKVRAYVSFDDSGCFDKTDMDFRSRSRNCSRSRKRKTIGLKTKKRSLQATMMIARMSTPLPAVVVVEGCLGYPSSLASITFLESYGQTLRPSDPLGGWGFFSRRFSILSRLRTTNDLRLPI